MYISIIYVSMYLSIYVSSIYVSNIYVSIYLCIYLSSMYLCIYVSMYLSFITPLIFHLPIIYYHCINNLSICLSTNLSSIIY